MLATFSSPSFCQLSELSVIAVSGKDAITFLHQQLTNAVTDLDESMIRLAGLCSPQGRLLATMNYYRIHDQIRLITSADIAASLLKRLSMFVLRAQVRLQSVDDDYAIFGLTGTKSGLLTGLPGLTDLPEVNQWVTYQQAQLLRLTDAAEVCRLLWLVPKAVVSTVSAQLLAAHLQQVTENTWKALEVYTGIPRVTLATQDKFVPQMINFELVAGVNFKKGCYPGQEVVARSQYRGKIKRRLQMAQVKGHAYPGMPIFHTQDPEQPCGMIVNAAPVADDRFCVLAEIQLAALQLQQGDIYLAEQPAAIFDFLPLPYPLGE
jgi:folate-binding protein YgfZ